MSLQVKGTRWETRDTRAGRDTGLGEGKQHGGSSREREWFGRLIEKSALGVLHFDPYNREPGPRRTLQFLSE
jgi:hypothetical protein